MKIKFISVDPSLKNTAVVYGYINDGVVIPEGYKLIQTEKSKNSKIIRDLVNRSKTILDSIHNLIQDWGPEVCFAELPTGSQSSQASIGVGISCCIIASLKEPVFTVTAFDVKMCAVGNKNASKKEIIAYCDLEYPEFPFERKRDKTIVETRMEHVCDAICVAEAGLKSKDFKDYFGKSPISGSP